MLLHTPLFVALKQSTFSSLHRVRQSSLPTAVVHSHTHRNYRLVMYQPKEQIMLVFSFHPFSRFIPCSSPHTLNTVFFSVVALGLPSEGGNHHVN